MKQRQTRSDWIFWLFLLLALPLVGCQPATVPPEKEGVAPVLELASWQELVPVLVHDKNLAPWVQALEASAAYYERVKPDTTFQFPHGPVAAPAMARVCRELAALARGGGGEPLVRAMAGQFTLYRSTGSDGHGKVLVTGYYEPLLRGAEKPDKRYAYPLYRRPKDMVDADLGKWFPDMAGKRLVGRVDGNKILPYLPRQEIDDGGKLAKKGLELLWVDDPVDAFFLHIQGSGRVQLADGRTVRVGYDAANGLPYKSIGAILIEEGRISREAMSLQALRKWLREHPQEQQRLLNANPSYVFFKIQQGGPFGNINVPLTPRRSIATDHRIFPKGAPVVVVTELPQFKNNEVSRWDKQGFWSVNQDTGGAIRGAGRVDLFMGYGEEAERTAGVMKQPGTLYFISPKAPPS